MVCSSFWVSEGLAKPCTDVWKLGCFWAVFKKLLLKTVYRKSEIEVLSKQLHGILCCYMRLLYSYKEFSRWTINVFNAAMLRSEGKWCLVRFCLLKHEKDVSSHLRSSLEVLLLDHNLSFNCACFLLKNLLHSCLLRKHQITTLLMFHYSIVS